jgi:hypothetical protein
MGRKNSVEGEGQVLGLLPPPLSSLTQCQVASFDMRIISASFQEDVITARFGK